MPLEGWYGNAQYLSLFAAIIPALPARLAFVAIYGRVKADSVVPFKTLYISAQPFDNASRLMAHNQRRNSSAGLACEALNVRTTNPTGLDANQHIIITYDRLRKIRIFKTIWFSID